MQQFVMHMVHFLEGNFMKHGSSNALL